MKVEMDFTDTEKICKYCYENGLSIDALDAAPIPQMQAAGYKGSASTRTG